MTKSPDRSMNLKCVKIDTPIYVSILTQDIDVIYVIENEDFNSLKSLF